MFRNLIFLFTVLISVTHSSAFAHEEAADSFNLDATMQLFQLAAELSPEIMADEFENNISQPVIKIRGKNIVMNTHFLELVRRWIRIYHKEILRDCQGCVNLSEDELLAEAKDLAAKGFFNTKVVTPLSHSIEHIALETADIGASFGNVALITKAASEVAETVLSKTVGGGGVHVLCNIIDMVIIFGTRHLQTAYRMPMWASKLGAGNGFTFPIRYWLTSHAIRRAQNRAKFFVGPIELDEEGMALVDQEGGLKKGWWGRMSEGKRARWLRYIEQKTKPLQAELAVVDEQLKENTSDRGLIKKRKSLENQIANLGEVKRKEFLGNRYLMTLFLKARRGSKNMSGDSPLEQSLKKDFLWIINVQENILHRGLIPEGDQTVAIQYAAQESLKKLSQDEVLVGLSEEVAGDQVAQKELVQGLLSDVDFIFNKDNPAAQRYLQTLVIESTLVNFFYKLVKWQTEKMSSGHENWFLHLATSSVFRWETGQFVRYVYEYTDFLRLAAATGNDKFRERYKYEAMETLLRIFKHLEKLSGSFNSGETANHLIAPVHAANKQLFSYKPWREKKTVFSWIPFVQRRPVCEEMWDVE